MAAPGEENSGVLSESGISNREDVIALESSGIDAMLVGTCLMESKDIGAKIDLLRGTKEGA